MYIAFLCLNYLTQGITTTLCKNFVLNCGLLCVFFKMWRAEERTAQAS